MSEILETTVKWAVRTKLENGDLAEDSGRRFDTQEQAETYATHVPEVLPIYAGRIVVLRVTSTFEIA